MHFQKVVTAIDAGIMNIHAFEVNHELFAGAGCIQS